jgi:hypothetical protein
MFTKQVSHRVDSPDPPSCPRRRSGRANSNKDLVTGPIRRFCALQVFIGAGLLVAAGLTLAARFWSFSDGWIGTSIGLVITLGIAGSIVGRSIDRLRGALQSAPDGVPDGVPSADLTLLARNPVLHASSRISVAIIGEILFLMSVKPAAPGILWSLLVAAGIGAIAIWPLFIRRQHQPAFATESAPEDTGAGHSST